jgi:hypothetical protein
MKPRFLDTGPPLQKVDATGSNRGTSQSRYQPDPASEIPHFWSSRQVATHSPGLIHVREALSQSGWFELRTTIAGRRTT